MKRVPSMATVWVFAATAGVTNSAAAAMTSTIPVLPAQRRIHETTGTQSPLILLPHLGLDAFCMFEMRNKCRSHLDQQCFQLFVLCVRYQCLVQRIDDSLMIGHLVSDVSAIE